MFITNFSPIKGPMMKIVSCYQYVNWKKNWKSFSCMANIQKKNIKLNLVVCNFFEAYSSYSKLV